MRKKIELEYVLRSSPKLLFPRLSTPAGLSEWFADNVTVREKNVYDFHWDRTVQSAIQTYLRENVAVRYEWVDIDEKNTNFFEFRLKQDELTGDLALSVVDFCEEDEYEETIEIWNNQIARLKHLLGIN